MTKRLLSALTMVVLAGGCLLTADVASAQSGPSLTGAPRVFPPTPLSPRFACEGRTMRGECFRAEMGATARLRSVVMSQPKLSTSSSPSLPNVDWIYKDPAWKAHLRRFDDFGDLYIY